MDKLFFMRLSDKPGNVLEVPRKNRYTNRHETMILFSVGGKEFTFTSNRVDGICWIAELSPYNKANVNDHPPFIGNPGGYHVARVQLVWKDKNLNKAVQNFVSQ